MQKITPPDILIFINLNQIKRMSIIANAEQYVIQLFKDKLSSTYSFHNIDHTRRVVEAATLLADRENINGKEKEALLLAAWFHDVGYCESCTSHESIGMNLAAEFLHKENVEDAEINKVKNLINATALHVLPQDILEKIIKDADTSHLASDKFFEITESLREECKKAHDLKLSREEWAKKNLSFLQSHQFYTDFAKNNWDKKKQETLQKHKNLSKNCPAKRKKNSQLRTKKLY